MSEKLTREEWAQQVETRLVLDDLDHDQGKPDFRGKQRWQTWWEVVAVFGLLFYIAGFVALALSIFTDKATLIDATCLFVTGYCIVACGSRYYESHVRAIAIRHIRLQFQREMEQIKGALAKTKENNKGD